MKKLILLGACALLTTMISCTSDDFEDTKANIEPAVPTYADGPGDLPIKVPPPKKPD